MKYICTECYGESFTSPLSTNALDVQYHICNDCLRANRDAGEKLLRESSDWRNMLYHLSHLGEK